MATTHAEPADTGMRDWWLRTLLVLQRPRPVFVALRDESRDVGFGRHVRAERLGPPAGRCVNRLRGLLTRSERPARQCDVRAGFGERRGHRLPEPPRATRNERDLRIETEPVEDILVRHRILLQSMWGGRAEARHGAPA